MITAIIQARMGSTRLPGKILLPLKGEPVLFHVVERAKRVRGIDAVVVATTISPADDAIETFCKERGYSFFRGSETDVLDRYYHAARAFKSETIIRITSDCPLIDPPTIEQCIQNFQACGCDYLSSFVPEERTYPRGLDTEIFSFAALEKAWKEATEGYEREHVTPYIWENKKGEFSIGPMLKASPAYARTQYRLTLDYKEDYELLTRVYDQFYAPGEIIDVKKLIRYFDDHPELPKINAFHEDSYTKVGIRR